MTVCSRCSNDVPEFLWKDGDHLNLFGHPATTHMVDLEGRTNNGIPLARVTLHMYVERRLCSEVNHDVEDGILGLHVTRPLEEALGIALGAASACWDNLSGAGVFDSDRCKKILDELYEYVQSKGAMD